MNDLATKSEAARRTQRFLRELTGCRIEGADPQAEGDGLTFAPYPSHAEIDELMRRARLERALEVGRLLNVLFEKLRPPIENIALGRLTCAACTLGFLVGLAFVAAEAPGARGPMALSCAGAWPGNDADSLMCAA